MKEESFTPKREGETPQKVSGNSKSKKLLAASLLAGGIALGTVQDVEAKMPKGTTHSEQGTKIKEEKERNYYVNRLRDLYDFPGGGFTDDDEGKKILDRNDAVLIIKELAQVDIEAAWNALNEAEMYKKPWVKEIHDYLYELGIKNKDIRILTISQMSERYYSESQIKHMLEVFADANPTETLSALFGNYLTGNPYEKYNRKDWFKDVVYKAIDAAALKEKGRVVEMFGDTLNFHPPLEYKEYAAKRGIILQR